MRQLESNPALVPRAILLALLFASAPAVQAQPQLTQEQVAALTPLSPAAVPKFGTFWLLNGPFPTRPFSAAPLPCPPEDMPGAPIYDLGSGHFLVDDSEVDYTLLQQQRSLEASLRALEGGSEIDYGQPGPAYNYPEGSLWLEILNATSAGVDVVLHGTVPGQVYKLVSKTNLPALNWSIESSVHADPTQDWSLHTVPIIDRTNSLFLWAQSWTTNDDNGNSLPDWWEWEHFGNFDQTANGDYDQDGFSNWAEYVAAYDPNTIAFSITPLNQAVNTLPTPLSLRVEAGVPSSMAVLVDSWEFQTALWTNFSPTFEVNLGSEGWHQIWIGLRGRQTTSEQTWHSTKLDLQVTPPVLQITNPTSAIVAQPVVQVQGCCAQRLASISYDLTNANGVRTNQQVLVVGEHFDTNTLHYTTNYFHAYDVPLAPGTNSITIKAADAAGNNGQTNLIVVLDYTTKTNPPQAQLAWPNQGTIVATSNCIVRGWVDDPTAQVEVRITYPNGDSTSAKGRVGRNGAFAVEGLPLEPGTNHLRLTATDAAANASSTDFTILSEPILAIYSVLHNSVWGFVANSNYTIYVNGTNATLSPPEYPPPLECSFSAPLRLTLDTNYVRFQITPTAGGQVLEAEAPYQWPAGIVYSPEYHIRRDDTNSGTNRTARYRLWEDWQERSGGGGYEYNDLYGGGAQTQECATVYFPGRWPYLGDGYVYDLPSGPTNGWPAMSPLGFADFSGCGEYLTAEDAPRTYTWTENWNAQLTLVTGGKPESTDRALFAISAQCASMPNGWLIAPEQVTIGKLGNCDTNGKVYVALPEHDQVPVTPAAPGTNDYYNFNVLADAYKPKIVFRGAPLTDQPARVYVGERIELSCQMLPLPDTVAPLPPQFAITNWQWTIPGYAVANYTLTVSNTVVDTNILTSAGTNAFYWVDGGIKEIECTVSAFGESFTSRAKFNVLRPEATWVLTPKDHVAVDTNVCDPFGPTGYYYLRTGMNCSTNDVGMLYEYRATDLKGYTGMYQFQFYQIVTVDWKLNLAIDPQTNYAKFAIARGLDGKAPYEKWFVGSGFASDTPWDMLTEIWAADWRTESFECHLMFKPEGGIPVPVKKATWNWGGAAKRVNTNSPPRWVAMGTFTHPQPAIGVDSSELPLWTNHIANVTWTYQAEWFPVP